MGWPRASRCGRLRAGWGGPRPAVCREVAANGGGDRYRACAADRRAVRLMRRPRPAKLARCPRLREAAGEQTGTALVTAADRGLAEDQLPR